MAAKRTVTIRRSLLLNLLVLILLSSAAILGAYQYGVRRTVRTLSESIIHQAAGHIESQLEGFFTPLSHDLLAAAEWAIGGLFEMDDTPRMNRLFPSIIDHRPQISSIHVADDSGREYMLLKTGGGWLNRESNPVEWGPVARITEFDGRNPPLIQWRDIDYDARRRPWYQGTVERLAGSPMGSGADPTDRVHWTGHYTFFTTQDPGITAAVASRQADGGFRVVAYDLTLNDVSRFTSELKVSENGRVSVLSDDKFRIIGMPVLADAVDHYGGQAPFFHFDGTNRSCTVYAADMPLFGVMEDADPSLPEPVRMNPGDLFVVLSDGLIEPHDAGGDMYGKDRVIDRITRHLDGHPERILEVLVKDIEAFAGGAPPDDDRTAVIIKRKFA